MKFFRKSVAKRIFILLLSISLALYPLSAAVVIAEDSPEEIAREQQEAQLEAQRRAERQAAEEQRQQQEAEREFYEDNPTPAPTPTPSPQIIDTTSSGGDGTAASNSDTGADSFNDASSTSNTNIDATNSNTDTSLTQDQTTTANTGNNVISGDAPPSPSPSPTPGPGQEPLPGCEDSSGPESLSQDDTLSTPQDTNEGGGGSATEDGLQVDETNGEPQSDSVTATSTSEEDSDAVVASNQNCTDIHDNTTVSATTGENTSSSNDGSSNMQTGDGNSTGTVQNTGNVNTTEVSGANSAQNQGTEDNSVNNASSTSEDTIEVDNQNQASLESDLTVEASSGENALVGNDGAATLDTGDLIILAYLLNILNLNITGSDFTHLIINIFGELNGNVDLDDISTLLGMDDDYIEAVARNSQTGENSLNDATVVDNTNVDVNNQNQAAIRNDVNVTGTTGGNDISDNEDHVDALTGRIRILVAILNFINANFSGTDWYFAMVNIFGSLNGDLLLPSPDQYLAQTAATNSQTGANSDNDAFIDSSTDIAVNNENSAQVTNNVSATGDSGTNSAYANGDRVQMETGDTNVLSQIMNWLNFNITGDNFVLLIVNVFGHWLGRVIAFPGQGDLEAPESGTLVAAAYGSGDNLLAQNSQTGDGSSNNASVESSVEMNVNNQNQASIENNVNVTGVSGQNTTNTNKDGARIVTGWIDLSVDLFNIVNFNVTGRNFMLLIVNVFGDFFGNVVFPHQEIVSPAVAGVEQTQQAVNAVDNQINSNIGEVGDPPTSNEVVTGSIIKGGEKEEESSSQDIIFGSTDDFGQGPQNPLSVSSTTSFNSSQQDIEKPIASLSQLPIDKYLMGYVIVLTIGMLILRRWARKRVWKEFSVERIKLS